MDHESISDLHRNVSKELLKQESNDLLSAIEQLEKERQIQLNRLINAMNLVRLRILSSHRLS